MDLFSVEGQGLNIAYVHLKSPSRLDLPTRKQLDAMWSQYEPYADAAFPQGFARDVEGRFWEMYLGCLLLDAGHQLLRDDARPRKGGQPDLCVTDGHRRIWIEAISVTEGAVGPNQVMHPVPVNRGGEATLAPTREAQLRITSAFETKSQKMTTYLQQGVIQPADVRIIAINVSRFALLVMERPWPLIVRCLFPIGAEYATFDLGTGEVTDEGYRHEPIIHKSTGPIATDSFLNPAYSSISGVVYSRVGLSQLDRNQRPITFVHNPKARVPLEQHWGPWDREIVAQTEPDGEAWQLSDVRMNSED